MAEDTSIPLERVAQMCEQMNATVQGMESRVLETADGSGTAASLLRLQFAEFCTRLDTVAREVQSNRVASKTDEAHQAEIQQFREANQKIVEASDLAKGQQDLRISQLEADVTSLQTEKQSATDLLKKEHEAKVKSLEEALNIEFQDKLKKLEDVKDKERQQAATTAASKLDAERQKHQSALTKVREQEQVSYETKLAKAKQEERQKYDTELAEAKQEERQKHEADLAQAKQEQRQQYETDLAQAKRQEQRTDETNLAQVKEQERQKYDSELAQAKQEGRQKYDADLADAKREEHQRYETQLARVKQEERQKYDADLARAKQEQRERHEKNLAEAKVEQRQQHETELTKARNEHSKALEDARKVNNDLKKTSDDAALSHQEAQNRYQEEVANLQQQINLLKSEAITAAEKHSQDIESNKAEFDRQSQTLRDQHQKTLVKSQSRRETDLKQKQDTHDRVLTLLRAEFQQKLEIEQNKVEEWREDHFNQVEQILSAQSEANTTCLQAEIENLQEANEEHLREQSGRHKEILDKEKAKLKGWQEHLAKREQELNELEENLEQRGQDLEDREEDFEHREELLLHRSRRLTAQNTALKKQHELEVATLKEHHTDVLKASSEAYMKTYNSAMKLMLRESGPALNPEDSSSSSSSSDEDDDEDDDADLSSDSRPGHPDADRPAFAKSRPLPASKRTNDTTRSTGDEDSQEPTPKKSRTARESSGVSISSDAEPDDEDPDEEDPDDAEPDEEEPDDADADDTAADLSIASQVLPTASSMIQSTDALISEEKAQKIWAKMLLDWDASSEEEDMIRAQLASAFTKRRSVESMTELIDRYIVGSSIQEPPFPKACFFGSILQHKAGPGGSRMTEKNCPYCRQKKGRICLWAIHAPTVASGFPPRISGRYDAKVGWQSSAQPQTIRVGSQDVRWILKRRKKNAGDDDDPQFIMKKLDWA